MSNEKGIFQRTELLFGQKKMNEIAQKRVILFGIGGVGSWCAESLVRSGIHHLTIVDCDRVNVTNINRQLLATTKTVGELKVDVMKRRLLEINPKAEITPIQRVYNPHNHDSFALDTYDFIIDAIDSLSCKIDLIRTATRTRAVFFSSMGASLKVDPTRIEVAEFWKVKGCPLGSKIRKLIRKGDLPAKKFWCVYSEELLENREEYIPDESEISAEVENGSSGSENSEDSWTIRKAVVNGTVSHITAIFGFTLAGLVIQHIYNGTKDIAEG